jgi:hypothetical protein
MVWNQAAAFHAAGRCSRAWAAGFTRKPVRVFDLPVKYAPFAHE